MPDQVLNWFLGSRYRGIPRGFFSGCSATNSILGTPETCVLRFFAFSSAGTSLDTATFLSSIAFVIEIAISMTNIGEHL